MYDMGSWVKNNALTIIIWIFGVVLGLFNLYQGFVLNAFSLEGRVLSLEKRAEKQDTIVERIPIIDDRQMRMVEDIKEIKISLDKLNDKLDNFLSYKKAASKTTASAMPVSLASPTPDESAKTTYAYVAQPTPTPAPASTPTPTQQSHSEPERNPSPLITAITNTIASVLGVK